MRLLRNGLLRYRGRAFVSGSQARCQSTAPTNLEVFQKAQTISLAGGSDKDKHRHTQINKKVLVHDRLKMLMDDYENDFVHLSTLAGYKMEYGTVPSGGVICGIGSISGKRCMVVAMDATVIGGTLFPIGVKKNVRAQAIAMQNRLPTVYVVDSGGAFLPLQAEIFNPGGAVFANIAKLSAQKISQISIVAGSCTAGAAYIPTMSDEVVIVNKISSIFLGGPPLVQAATGEVVTPEELGGATIHCEVSGYTDHMAQTEQEGFEMVRDIVGTVNCEAVSTGSGLAVSAGSEDRSIQRSVESMFDDGKVLSEFKKTYSDKVRTTLGYIEGNLCGIIANHSDSHLDDKAMNKAAHFVQLCSERDDVKMLIFMQNGDDHDPNEQSITTGYARFMQAVANCDTPRVTIITSHQNRASLLSPQSFEPSFTFRWPDAGYRDMSAVRCSAELWDDGVILPEQTREVLGKLALIVKRRNAARDEPIFRM